MFCYKCGKEIDEDSIFCVHCGAKVTNSPTAEISNSENLSESTDKLDASTRVLPKKYCYFNWGAMSLNIFYFFCNRLPGWGFLLLTLGVTAGFLMGEEKTCAFGFILLVIFFFVNIGLGVNANQMAWEKYPYQDGIEQFMKGQDKWNGWGIFFFILQLISSLSWFLFAVLLVGLVESID